MSFHDSEKRMVAFSKKVYLHIYEEKIILTILLSQFVLLFGNIFSGVKFPEIPDNETERGIVLKVRNGECLKCGKVLIRYNAFVGTKGKSVLSCYAKNVNCSLLEQILYRLTNTGTCFDWRLVK